MITRYLIYFITFVSSLIIASKLGPYYMGIWGFILLIIRYFHIVDFGLGNSITVLLVKNKEDKEVQAEYEVTSLVIIGIISLVIILVSLFYYLFGIEIINKYNIGNLFYAVMAIAIMQYYNDYLLKVYRAKGKMFEFTFYQSIIQILVFISVFLARGRQLIVFLTASYLIGHILSLVFFVFGKGINIHGRASLEKGKEIISKGFYLFIYNFSFYMIIISTKSLIGAYYTVEEFGYFTFAYTLAYAAILLLTAFSSLITPKLIDKFNTDNVAQIDNTIRLLRINYIYLAHGLMYVAMLVFPIILLFMHQYSHTLQVINLTALATILYTNSFGYISFLMAKNREKVLARNSLLSLIINIALLFVLIFLIKVTYEYVVIGTLISYFVFSYITVYSGKKELKQSVGFTSIMKECFPLGIFIPFIGAVIVTLFDNAYLSFIPIALFLCINLKEMREIFTSFKRIVLKPEIIDIK